MELKKKSEYKRNRNTVERNMLE